MSQLKIDQAFVWGILTDKNAAAIALTIIKLAESLNLDVIAEGVETHQQKDFLHELGCEMYQGYFFSRPLPRHQIEKLLEDPASNSKSQND